MCSEIVAPGGCILVANTQEDLARIAYGSIIDPETGDKLWNDSHIHTNVAVKDEGAKCGFYPIEVQEGIPKDRNMVGTMRGNLSTEYIRILLSSISFRSFLLDRFGISSIQAIKLLSWLESNYGGNLSIEHLSREGMSIRTLANTVQLAASGNLVPAVDIPREVREIAESILLDLRQRSVWFMSLSKLAAKKPASGSISSWAQMGGRLEEAGCGLAWRFEPAATQLTKGTLGRVDQRNDQQKHSQWCIAIQSRPRTVRGAADKSGGEINRVFTEQVVSELIVSRVADEFQKRLVAGAMDAGIRSSGHDDEWTYVCDVEQAAKRVVNSSGILFPSMRSTEDSHVTTIMDGIYLRDL
ncbi:s-adenosyl-l-methionine-dependent methyltransferase-like [Fusarium flagelliforme]|uniref:S-adenosyl-l-methionine-dependent methyltransferase-like n=1 Tax=Fusarium flagelliforme TaxID=2675880 RepID=A0A395M8E4_9HYPO|nr:s-adenosyl-l-methionine-dependent methyltransferase-like [Fusarium flagelliforme]